jgi:formate dehydrogenase major subunit
MTNTWTDIGTSDVIMVIGGNPAENHPMAFKHITRALDNHYGNTGPAGNGAKLMVFDPRYTRTASRASAYNGNKMYSHFRSGTDIALINNMIWYVMSTNQYNREYVLSYSNAGFLVNEGFEKPGDLGQDGVYSGFTATAGPHPVVNCSTGNYDKTTWGYCTYAPGHAQEYRAVNIATDFWDGAGNCQCGACTFTNTNLSLDPADPHYIGAFRTHLFAPGGPLDGVANFSIDQETVWEHMREHYSRYTGTQVQNICGVDWAVYQDMRALYAQTGQHGKAGTIMYAMGTTQHTVGTQNIRGYSTLQMLLGNMGVSGGGVNAQRGESNVQGSTDHCLLFHILPGYITMPASTNAGDAVFDGTNVAVGDGTPGHPLQPASYVKRGTPFQGHKNELNWWGFWNGQSNFKRYIASLMKCYWWDALGASGPDTAATPAQMQTVYDYIPKLPGNASHIEIFEQMHAGNISGLFCFGQNPAVGGPNSVKEREALRNLEYLVVSELWETETAAFWQADTTGRMYDRSNPADLAEMEAINTEVFLLPAACHLEKEGSVTNSSRWAQYRYKAVEPPGNIQIGSDLIPLGAKHEIWMINALYEEIKALCTTAVRDDPIQSLTMGNWWYSGRCGEPVVNGYADPSADYLDKEINGQNAFDNTNPSACSQVAKFTVLKDDGTTSSGNWLYSGMYDSTGNKSMKRDNTQAAGMAPIYSNWAWDWPVNRRIIYNGASLVPCGFGGVTGTPWDANHPVVWWTTTWAGDVNDGIGNPHGVAGHGERTPFIMKPEGHCRLHGHGRAEGPYPEHYEPLDSPFAGLGNPMGHSQLINPAIKVYEPGKIGSPGDYPIVATTYRCTEHWQAGAATRHLPWQCEIWPDVVVEMSLTLASSKGIANGDKVQIESARNAGKPMEAYALVTDRFTTFNTSAGDLEHVGVFWHFGYKGIATGDSANMLTPHVGDANTRIPEYKAFLCKITKV